MRGHPNQQILMMYLLTCPSANMLGLYYLPLPVIVHETGLSEVEVRAAMAWLTHEEAAHYDFAQELVFVPQMAFFQIADYLKAGDKRTEGIRRDLATFRGHPFAIAFARLYNEPFNLGFGSSTDFFVATGGRRPQAGMTSEAPSKALLTEQEAPPKPGSGSGTGSGTGGAPRAPDPTPPTTGTVAPAPGPPEDPPPAPSARRYPMHVVGGNTEAFMRAYNAYCRRDGMHKAATAFQEHAAVYPGGEEAFAAALVAAFRGGMLQRHPYDSAEHRFRPLLETVIREERWRETPGPAAPPPAREPKALPLPKLAFTPRPRPPSPAPPAAAPPEKGAP
jgi:hypothetical protein